MTSREDWIARVEATLKGKAFDAELSLQGRIEGPAATRPAQIPWRIFQRVDHVDHMDKAHQQAENDLANGADGLVLTSVSALPVFTRLPLHQFSLRNEAGDTGAEGVRALVGRLPLDPARLDIDFGIHEAALAKIIHGDGFTSPLMRADGRAGHMQGLDHAAELGTALANALGHWRKLDFLDDASLATSVSMTLAATQDMFGTLAKFRAARILWSSLLSAAGLPEAPLTLHAETSRIMLAAVDPHSNILRAVTAVFGAGLGGADSICVLPFSFNQGVPNAFARRVARNVQHLLLHESQLWRVSDPAAGAGVAENLTDRICAEAWEVMQACERGDWPGGDASKAKAQPVIGVTKYINPHPPMAEIEGAA